MTDRRQGRESIGGHGEWTLYPPFRSTDVFWSGRERRGVLPTGRPGRTGPANRRVRPFGWGDAVYRAIPLSFLGSFRGDGVHRLTEPDGIPVGRRAGDRYPDPGAAPEPKRDWNLHIDEFAWWKAEPVPASLRAFRAGAWGRYTGPMKIRHFETGEGCPANSATWGICDCPGDHIPFPPAPASPRRQLSEAAKKEFRRVSQWRWEPEARTFDAILAAVDAELAARIDSVAGWDASTRAWMRISLGLPGASRP